MSIQDEHTETVTQDEITQILQDCLDELFEKDLWLLQNDVSERAITHKLAEYLQFRFPKMYVDCEYNRNYENGEYASKTLKYIDVESQRIIRKILRRKGLVTDDLLA